MVTGLQIYEYFMATNIVFSQHLKCKMYLHEYLTKLNPSLTRRLSLSNILYIPTTINLARGLSDSYYPSSLLVIHKRLLWFVISIMYLLGGVVQLTDLIPRVEVEGLTTFLKIAIRHAVGGVGHFILCVHHVTF